jgi:hypothetical protein
MHAQDIFELIIDANKNAYEISWNAFNNFQEKAEERMKTAFDQAPLPQATKDAALKSIDAYKIIARQVLDTSRIVYDSVLKTVTASGEKAVQMTREDFDTALLQQYPHMILSL